MLPDGPPGTHGVVVTGAGGPAGVAVIRALARAGHRIAATDADPLAVGLRLADHPAVLPRYYQPGYVDQLCRLAEKTHSRVVVSTLAEEMPLLARAEGDLAGAGLSCWLPPSGAVARCVDKWRFAAVLEEAGLPGPRTSLGGAGDIPGPWVVKPRFGRGSRHVYAVDHREELAWALARVPEALVQSRLQGREFTVDALVDRRGRLAGAVPRWRLETRAGISVKGETFRDDELTSAVAHLLGALGLRGAANVQGFVDDRGRVAFVEVNPRFSGGLPLALAAGADLVGEYLRGALGLHVRPSRLAFRPGVRMLRYFEEIYEEAPER